MFQAPSGTRGAGLLAFIPEWMNNKSVLSRLEADKKKRTKYADALSITVVVVFFFFLSIFLKECSCGHATKTSVTQQRPQVMKQPAVLGTMTQSHEIWPLD